MREKFSSKQKQNLLKNGKNFICNKHLNRTLHSFYYAVQGRTQCANIDCKNKSNLAQNEKARKYYLEKQEICECPKYYHRGVKWCRDCRLEALDAFQKSSEILSQLLTETKRTKIKSKYPFVFETKDGCSHRKLNMKLHEENNSDNRDTRQMRKVFRKQFAVLETAVNGELTDEIIIEQAKFNLNRISKICGKKFLIVTDTVDNNEIKKMCSHFGIYSDNKKEKFAKFLKKAGLFGGPIKSVRREMKKNEAYKIEVTGKTGSGKEIWSATIVDVRKCIEDFEQAALNRNEILFWPSQLNYCVTINFIYI